MPKRKTPVQPEPPNWHIKTVIWINGRRVEPGTELKIEGMRGRFRFIRHVHVTPLVENPHEYIPSAPHTAPEDQIDCCQYGPGHPIHQIEREWIDVVGGATRKRGDMLRSFRLDRVKTVHRIKKTRANVAV